MHFWQAFEHLAPYADESMILTVPLAVIFQYTSLISVVN